jgi:preprotein translocase subunit YajC
MTPALGTLDALLAGPAATGKSSNGSSTLLVFVVIGAGFYFLIYRPQQKKQRATKALANTYEVGDEVVTAGGIVGWVLDITDDRVTLETSVGASFTVLKPYVLRKLEPADPPPDVVGDESDHDETDHDEDGGNENDGDENGGAAPSHEDVQHDSTHGSGEAPELPTGGPNDKGSDGTDASGSDGPPII